MHLNIHLMNDPGNNSKQSANIDHFGNKSKSFIIVQALN